MKITADNGRYNTHIRFFKCAIISPYMPLFCYYFVTRNKSRVTRVTNHNNKSRVTDESRT